MKKYISYRETSIEVIRANFEINPLTGDVTRKTYSARGLGKPGDTGSWVRGYRKFKIRKKIIKAHCLAWALVYGKWPDGDIDHINGVKHDNRIENLRDCSHRDNMRNRKVCKRNRSGVKGVEPLKSGRFKATITTGGKVYNLGVYETLAEAAAARRAAEVKFYGDFAPRH